MLTAITIFLTKTQHIMKNLKTTLSILAIFIFSTACQQQDEVSIQPEFVEVEIPDVYKSSINSRTAYPEVDDLIVDVQLTTIDGKEVAGKVHLVMPDDETLIYMAVTENILSSTKLTPDFWKQAIGRYHATSRKYESQGCFASCRGMKKGKGKGTCKALCWLQIIKDVATVIVTVVTISNT